MRKIGISSISPKWRRTLEAHLCDTVVTSSCFFAQIEHRGSDKPEKNISKLDDDDMEFISTEEAEEVVGVEVVGPVIEYDVRSLTRDVVEIRPDPAEEHSNAGDNGSTVLGQLVSAATEDSSAIQIDQIEDSL